MKNILFVCVGNICRSPMAEGFLKNWAQEKNLDLSISSAGLQALVGRSADQHATQLMQTKRIDISLHRAQQLTTELLLAADLVLVMEAWQQKEVGCIFPSAYGKVHRLGKWAGFDVPDPYGESVTKFAAVGCLIEEGLKDWQERLWK